MVSRLEVSAGYIDLELARRQKGYGRGERMRIEADRVEILSGIRDGKTTGAPVAFLIKNNDYENWKGIMSADKKEGGGERYVPRPGHADLPGVEKFGFKDIRNVIERSSARETAARVVAGAICRKFLAEFGVVFYSRVIQVGSVRDVTSWEEMLACGYGKTDSSDVRNIAKEEEMKKEIDSAREKGESVGGVFELVADGLCPGIGSYTQWDRRLDASIARCLMSIPGIKGVELGAGFGGMNLAGSQFHDSIFMEKGKGFRRRTNNAGGVEGGITNGEKIWVKCAMKPIPTLKNPLESFDIRTLKPEKSYYERSDTCAVVPASVVGENFLAFALAESFIEKFAGDSMEEVKANYMGYLESIAGYWKRG